MSLTPALAGLEHDIKGKAERSKAITDGFFDAHKVSVQSAPAVKVEQRAPADAATAKQENPSKKSVKVVPVGRKNAHFTALSGVGKVGWFASIFGALAAVGLVLTAGLGFWASAAILAGAALAVIQNLSDSYDYHEVVGSALLTPFAAAYGALKGSLKAVSGGYLKLPDLWKKDGRGSSDFLSMVEGASDMAGQAILLAGSAALALGALGVLPVSLGFISPAAALFLGVTVAVSSGVRLGDWVMQREQAQQVIEAHSENQYLRSRSQRLDAQAVDVERELGDLRLRFSVARSAVKPQRPVSPAIADVGSDADKLRMQSQGLFTTNGARDFALSRMKQRIKSMRSVDVKGAPYDFSGLRLNEMPDIIEMDGSKTSWVEPPKKSMFSVWIPPAVKAYASLTSGFGDFKQGGPFRSLDVSGPAQGVVINMVPGVVRYADFHDVTAGKTEIQVQAAQRSFGNTVIVESDDGKGLLVYQHLGGVYGDGEGSLLKAGDRVESGEYVGALGLSGKKSSSPHVLVSWIELNG
ncbi:MAG: hypothetical protein AABZ44_09230, partial [Elusimicrobiota bacterium]